MSRYLAFLLSLVALFAGANLAVAAERDLTGVYDCVGTTDGGRQYRGEVTIKQTRQGYQVSWKVGQTEYRGIGFVDEGRLNVAWAMTTPQGAVVIGVVVYKIGEEGILNGKWIDPGLKAVYTETLRPQLDARTV